MRKTEIKTKLNQFDGSYDEVLKVLFGKKKNKKLSFINEDNKEIVFEVLRTIASKQGDYVGETANEYYAAGSTSDVVPPSTDPTLTKWGYKKEKKSKAVINKRIAHMKKHIKQGTWSGRALRFAKHHLAGLIREKETFGQ